MRKKLILIAPIVLIVIILLWGLIRYAYLDYKISNNDLHKLLKNTKGFVGSKLYWKSTLGIGGTLESSIRDNCSYIKLREKVSLFGESKVQITGTSISQLSIASNGNLNVRTDFDDNQNRGDISMVKFKSYLKSNNHAELLPDFKIFKNCKGKEFFKNLDSTKNLELNNFSDKLAYTFILQF